MEYHTNSHVMILERHEQEILRNGKFITELRSQYPALDIRFTQDGLKFSGLKENVACAATKANLELEKLLVTTLPVSQSVRTLLGNDSIYAHIQSVFKTSDLNAAYDYSKKHGNIILVYASTPSDSDRARTILKQEFVEEYVSITKDLEKRLKRGSILQDKLLEKRDEGTLLYFEKDTVLCLHGLTKTVASVKSLIKKLTLQPKASEEVYIKPYNKDKYSHSDSLLDTDDAQNEPENIKQEQITMKKYEVLVVSMLPVIQDLAIQELTVEFDATAVSVTGKCSDVDAVLWQIQESQKGILSQFDVNLSFYKTFLTHDCVLERFAEIFKEKHIIASYYIDTLVYVCGVDRLDINRAKSVMIESLDYCIQYIKESFSSCYSSNGCMGIRLEQLDESGNISYIIDWKNFLYVYGFRDAITQLKELIDNLSKDPELQLEKCSVCPHVNSNSDVRMQSLKTYKLDSFELEENPIKGGRFMDTDKSGSYDIQEQHIKSHEADILLMLKISENLEKTIPNLIVKIMDDKIVLRGPTESVDTAWVFIEDTLANIVGCSLQVNKDFVESLPKDEFNALYKKMFKTSNVVGLCELEERILFLYTVGHSELQNAVQVINLIVTEFSKKTTSKTENTSSHLIWEPLTDFASGCDKPAFELEGEAHDVKQNSAQMLDSRRPETSFPIPVADCDPNISSNCILSSEFDKTSTCKHATNEKVLYDDIPHESSRNSCANTATCSRTKSVCPKHSINNIPSEYTHNSINTLHDKPASKTVIKLYDPSQSIEKHGSPLSTTTSTNTTTSHTLPFQTYAKDDVESLLTSKETHDYDIKDKNAESATKPKYKFRNLASTSFKQTNPTTVSSKHELVPSGNRHTVTRTVSTPPTRQMAEDILTTSSTSRFIIDKPLPSTSSQASTSIYSRSLSSYYEHMDIDMTGSYMYAPRRKQKLTIIDSFRVAKTKVSLVVGCITLCQVDVIINETNPDLNLCQGAVSSAILEKEQGMQAECNAKSPQGIDTGEVCITQANSMKCQFVYHVTCCEEKDARQSSEKAIKDTVLCCLTAINDTNLSSVAISPLGTTRSRVPRDKSAVVMLEEIVDFLTNHKDTTITHIDIVLHEMDTRSHPVFEDEFANVALKFDPERRKTRSRYSWMRNYDWQL